MCNICSSCITLESFSLIFPLKSPLVKGQERSFAMHADFLFLFTLCLVQCLLCFKTSVRCALLNLGLIVSINLLSKDVCRFI